MNTDSNIDPFWVLYLVNVLAPVSRERLEIEAAQLLKSMPSRSEPVDLDRWLRELVDSQLSMIRSDGLYAVTSLGLERLSQFKFGRIRDKNRLFELKKRLKKG
jgi:hypothetical protein